MQSAIIPIVDKHFLLPTVSSAHLVIAGSLEQSLKQPLLSEYKNFYLHWIHF